MDKPLQLGKEEWRGWWEKIRERGPWVHAAGLGFLMDPGWEVTAVGGRRVLGNGPSRLGGYLLV